MLTHDPSAHASAQVFNVAEILAGIEGVQGLDLGGLDPAIGALLRSIDTSRDALVVILERARRDAAERLAAGSSVAAFVASKCRRGPKCSADTGELFEAYARWCGGEPPVDRRGLGRLLLALGFTKAPTNGGRCAWLALGLAAQPSYAAEILAAGRVHELPTYRVEVTGPRGLVGTAIVVVGDNNPIITRARRPSGDPFSVTAPMRAAIRDAITPTELELELEAAE